MIIIYLQGGLGNQMFQFAFASILAKKNNQSVFLDKSFFDCKGNKLGFTPRKFELDVFDVKYLEVTNNEILSFFKLSFFTKLKKKLGFNYAKSYQEPTYNFQEQALLLKAPVHIRGYFQSYKYFFNDENVIRALFAFPIDKTDIVNNKLINTVYNLPNSVSIHIRRGDYVENLKTQQRHGNCSISYYQEAIHYLCAKFGTLNLLFFSDDINWVKSQFNEFSHSKIFIDHNKNEGSWKDMCLMSKCNHNVIANSSFSWWGAYLNDNPNKCVIAPRNWFSNVESSNDLLPEDWVRL